MAKKSLVSALIIALMVVSLVSGVVLAMADPDSTPNLSNIKANRNLITAGDILIYGDYNIPYASPPSVGADESYLFILKDGATTVGIVKPFAMLDNGYNKGVFSFYSENFTWGTAYTIRITQNPSHFATPTVTDFIIPDTAYTSASDQDTNRSQLTINIISAAQRLETYYTNYTFLDSTAGGTVLSSPTGETYFRGAIYGVQAMAPDLFLVQTLDIYTTGRTWTTDQFDNYEGRFDNTWIGATENATATQFGITTSMVMGMLFIFPLSIGTIIVSSIKLRRTEPGLAACALFLIMGAIMGWIPAPLFAAIFQSLSIYLAYVWFYARG